MESLGVETRQLDIVDEMTVIIITWISIKTLTLPTPHLNRTHRAQTPNLPKTLESRPAGNPKKLAKSAQINSTPKSMTIVKSIRKTLFDIRRDFSHARFFSSKFFLTGLSYARMSHYGFMHFVVG